MLKKKQFKKAMKLRYKIESDMNRVMFTIGQAALMMDREDKGTRLRDFAKGLNGPDLARIAPIVLHAKTCTTCEIEPDNLEILDAIAVELAFRLMPSPPAKAKH